MSNKINQISSSKNYGDTNINELVEQPYRYGFKTDVETEDFPKGISEKIIILISQKKNEPDFMVEFRLRAYKAWKAMLAPEWACINYNPINYQDILYYSVPKSKKTLSDLNEVDAEILSTFEKLGIPLTEQKRLANVAVDAIFDSVSIGTTFREELSKVGVIFCPISEALKSYPDLVKKYIGTVVPIADNYFAALNSAVFTEGSFCYIPKDIICPLDLSTYFRINNEESGQFERTLIIADKNSKVNYLEGCTAPKFDRNQLHAAVVELVALEKSQIRYSTVQNWYAGDSNGLGGIYNLRKTKKGILPGTAKEQVR